MTVLVGYASKHGSTAEIAEAIAGTLRETGLDVDCREAADVKSLDRYDAVVLGSAVYLKRWRASAKRLLRKHADSLATMPFWVFNSGPVGDPAEDAEASDWLQPPRIVERVEALGAREHVVLGGRAPVGSKTEKRTPEEFRDRRDWDEIRAWGSPSPPSFARPPPSRRPASGQPATSTGGNHARGDADQDATDGGNAVTKGGAGWRRSSRGATSA